MNANCSWPCKEKPSPKPEFVDEEWGGVARLVGERALSVTIKD